ncbi:retrovirus-related pol polyprotein from transposon TNT 1-94 [Tanacetum coccineum]
MINPGQAKPIKGKQVTNVEDDVDDSQENDLALNVDHIFEADEKKFALGEICQLTKLSVKCSTLSANQQAAQNSIDGNRSTAHEFCGKVHRGSVRFGQFCDFKSLMAFRKHTCCVRDLNGTDILKGSRGTNLYTISIDEMMKSSPICLLSKASKSKSWLWHRRLNYYNLGTNISCSKRKIWLRGLPRLKIEKDIVAQPVGLNKTVRFIRTDNGTEFVNQVMSKYYEGVGIFHQKSVENSLTKWRLLKGGLQPVIGPLVNTNQVLRSRTDKELDMYYQQYLMNTLHKQDVDEQIPFCYLKINAQVVPPGSSLSTTIAQDAPSTSASSSTSDIHLPVQLQEIAEEPVPEDTPIIHNVLPPSHNLVTGDPGSAQSSSGNVNAAEPNQVNYPPDHIRRWTKDHPLDNIVGNPSRPVSTRKQLASDALWCCFHTELSRVEPKNFKMAVIEDCWFQAMQDEIHEFDRLEVWELVPRPIYVMLQRDTSVGRHMILKESYAPVASDKAIRIFIAISIQNMIIYQMMSKLLYQNGDLQEEVLSVKNPLRILKTRKTLTHVIRLRSSVWAKSGHQGRDADQLRDVKIQEEVRPEKVTQFLGDRLVSWSSKKQRSTTISTTEAEYIANDSLEFDGRYTNVPAQPPTRTDEQIVPRSQWLTIGKSNLLFNAQKIQKNPIFQISVDILKNTNFFQALTASANVPAIYLQQFWKTMSYNEKTGVYSCQLDEQWFDLSADLLRKALAITPVNPTHPFEFPPTGDTGNSILAQPVLDRRLLADDKPRHPVLQMLWGIVTQTNVDHAELIWEEFTQGIQTFFSHKASHKASLKNPKKKATPLLIPYGRFSKVIIYYLASNNNIHRRPDSAVHHTGDDVLGNLKFVPKGETVEVFGMATPNPDN